MFVEQKGLIPVYSSFLSSRWARPIYSIVSRVNGPGPLSWWATRVNDSEHMLRRKKRKNKKEKILYIVAYHSHTYRTWTDMIEYLYSTLARPVYTMAGRAYRPYRSEHVHDSTYIGRRVILQLVRLSLFRSRLLTLPHFRSLSVVIITSSDFYTYEKIDGDQYHTYAIVISLLTSSFFLLFRRGSWLMMSQIVFFFQSQHIDVHKHIDHRP